MQKKFAYFFLGALAVLALAATYPPAILRNFLSTHTDAEIQDASIINVRLPPFSVDGDPDTDDTMTVSNAFWYAQYSPVAPKNLFFPSGTYKVRSLPAINRGAVQIEGESASMNTGFGTTFLLDMTNRGGFLFTNCNGSGLKKALVIYNTMQHPTNTESVAVRVDGGNTSRIELEEVYIRRAAHALMLTNLPFNCVLDSIRIGSFSRSAFKAAVGTSTTVNNLYVQNSWDQQVANSVTVTNITTPDGTNLTLWCSSLPVYICTNAPMEALNLGGVDGLYFCKWFESASNSIDIIATTDKRPLGDVSGAIRMPGQPCAEPPVQTMAGNITILGADVEWFICTNMVFGLNVAWENTVSTLFVTDIHFEGIMHYGRELIAFDHWGRGGWIGTIDLINSMAYNGNQNVLVHMRGTASGSSYRPLTIGFVNYSDNSIFANWGIAKRAEGNSAHLKVMGYSYEGNTKANAGGTFSFGWENVSEWYDSTGVHYGTNATVGRSADIGDSTNRVGYLYADTIKSGVVHQFNISTSPVTVNTGNGLFFGLDGNDTSTAVGNCGTRLAFNGLMLPPIIDLRSAIQGGTSYVIELCSNSIPTTYAITLEGSGASGYSVTTNTTWPCVSNVVYEWNARHNYGSSLLSQRLKIVTRIKEN